MNRRLQTAIGSGMAAFAVAALTVALWPTMSRPAQASTSDGDDHYASPLEVLLSPDGNRL